MTTGIHPFLRGFLSQWHPSNFTIDGILFGNAEQFMMYKKAGLFGDAMIAEKILNAKYPSDHKRLGQQVRGFNQQDWDDHKIQIVYTGNWAKFTQNNGLRKKLLATRDALLVEANPKDIIWGVGLSENDPNIADPNFWRGQNLLGEILMRVRTEIESL